MSGIDSRVVTIDELKLERFAKGDKFECNAVRIGTLHHGAETRRMRAGDLIWTDEA